MAMLYWDGSAGAAGDMLLASLLDAGADWARIEPTLRAALPGAWRVTVERVVNGGLRALHVEVTDPDEPEMAPPGPPHDHDHAHPHPHGRHHGHDPHHDDPGHGHNHGHNHDHNHDHNHGHNHNHDHDHDHDRGRDGRRHGPHRHLADLLAMARHPAMPARAGARAERAFRALAEAEGRVHGRPPEEVHFHEVGAVDTAVDVLGVCLALEQLGVDAVRVAPPFVGAGTVRCAHGVLPVPAPAVVELLRAHRLAYRPGGADAELLTPTGAALLATLADGDGAAGPAAVAAARLGYGAGRRVLPDRPNVVRAALADDAPTPAGPDAAAPPPAFRGWRSDEIWSWEAAVDDMTPEAVGYWLERVLAAGALDAHATPAMMKKNRPGWRLTALVGDARADAVAETLARETASFGWRVRRETRRILDRRVVAVAVDGRRVRVKEGLYGGEVVTRAPEYEDARAAAAALGLPLAEVYRRALGAAPEDATP